MAAMRSTDGKWSRPKVRVAPTYRPLLIVGCLQDVLDMGLSLRQESRTETMTCGDIAAVLPHGSVRWCAVQWVGW